MIRQILVLAALGLLINVTSVSAHHGLEGYNTRQLIVIEGKVVGFELMDPHSVLYVDVTNRDGSVTAWMIEGGSASGIINSGITVEFLRSEPEIAVEAYHSMDQLCTPKCRASGRDFDFQDN